jgi:hypothetical protein
MADAGPVARLKRIVADRGWRMSTQTDWWKLTGMRTRSVQIHDGKGMFVAGACVVFGRDGSLERASASCAEQLLASG